jgi:macrolide-specific efflux system membrane fusion protein
MRRWLKWIVLFLCIAAAGGGWWYFNQPAKAVAPTTTSVAKGTIEDTVLASGTIEASSLVSVGAQVSGTIKTLNVALGDNVKSGDVIAVIDSLNQENAVKKASAALANVEAQRKQQQATLDQAKVSLTRAQQLNPQKIVSDADLQTAELAVATAEAQLESYDAQIQTAELSVESAKLDLSRTQITAPQDGTIVAVEVEVGQTVNATNSSPTIVKIANLDNMVVKAEISEADVPRVKAGQRVYFTILGDPDTKIDATLRDIEPAPDSISDDTTSSSSSSAIYYNGLFDVANPDHKLRISMTAQVTIVLEEAKDVLTLPVAALGPKGPDGGYMVRVLNADGKIEPKRIEVGLNNKVTAEIKSGLSEGDKVVTSTRSGSTTSAAAATTSTTTGTQSRNLLSGGPSGGGAGGPPPF